jgi:hypothetical protein
MQEYLTGVAVALNSLRQPVIAAVNGPAVGGGLGFAWPATCASPPRRRASARCSCSPHA